MNAMAATKPMTAADLTRTAMAPGLDAAGQSRWAEDAATCLRRHGVISIRDAIPKALVAAALADRQVRHDVHMSPGQRKLYRSFQSDPLRAQIPTPVAGPVADPAFFAPPSVMAVLKTLMGEDLVVGQMGVVITHAGAGAQEIHRDSNFLFGGQPQEIDLPPFAVTMLVPLLDVTDETGPTEFWPGSHKVIDEATATAGPPMRLPQGAGCVTLHDARLFHRGGAKASGPVRPAVYFGFHRPWYQEHPGYEHKPQILITPAMLEQLPAAYRPMFAWALHLNRTDGVHEFLYRAAGRLRRQLLKLRGG